MLHLNLVNGVEVVSGALAEFRACFWHYIVPCTKLMMGTALNICYFSARLDEWEAPKNSHHSFTWFFLFRIQVGTTFPISKQWQ
jgi:hypothetical protein